MSYAYPATSKASESSSTASPSAAVHEQNPPPLDLSTADISSSTAPRETESPASPISSPGAWLTYPVNYAVSSLYRRVSAPPDPRLTGLLQAPSARPSSPRRSATDNFGGSSMWSRSSSRSRKTPTFIGAGTPIVPPLPGGSAVFQPSHRSASPFQPPPLTALSLTGVNASTSTEAQILNKALAEEIRLLLPPRLQLLADWRLVYSVEQDGASLATLYSKCEGVATAGSRSGFVVVVRDGAGGIFGAYLTDPPHPNPSYYGTGECFLWSASIQTVEQMLAHLPPPPSEDTTHMEGRSTTLMSPLKSTFGDLGSGGAAKTNGGSNGHLAPDMSRSSTISRAPTEEERIRFKAFPYSGINDYMIYCEHGYMSVGGGDGKYGLWLDDRLEQGISSPSLTFGNESLSEEGEKFEAMGVEVWFIGG